MDEGDHERIDDEEVRRSEDELATVGNSCGFVASGFVVLVLVLPLALLVIRGTR